MNAQEMVITVQSSEIQSCIVHFKTVEQTKQLPDYFWWLLEYVLQHKHLGLMLSSDLGWSDHIDNIVKKAYKTQTVYIENLDSLYLQMHMSFVRSQFAVEVLSGCTVRHWKTKMVQLYAVRKVTGLLIIASRNSLY